MKLEMKKKPDKQKKGITGSKEKPMETENAQRLEK